MWSTESRRKMTKTHYEWWEQVNLDASDNRFDVAVAVGDADKGGATRPGAGVAGE
jgi:hypothetical protein